MRWVTPRASCATCLQRLMSKVFIASDHAGFALKQSLAAYLEGKGHEVEDLGAYAPNPRDDYPDFVTPCAKRVAEEPGSFGILIGGSGQGEAMAANRVKGARAAVFYGEPAQQQTDADGTSLGMISSVREHNDANMLSLAARFLSEDAARAAVDAFLATPFSGAERHARRLAQF